MHRVNCTAIGFVQAAFHVHGRQWQEQEVFLPLMHVYTSTWEKGAHGFRRLTIIVKHPWYTAWPSLHIVRINTQQINEWPKGWRASEGVGNFCGCRAMVHPTTWGMDSPVSLDFSSTMTAATYLDILLKARCTLPPLKNMWNISEGGGDHSGYFQVVCFVKVTYDSIQCVLI